MRPGRHPYADLEAFVGLEHVLLPLRVALLAGARVAHRRGLAGRVTTDREAALERPVEPDVHLLGPPHAHEVVLPVGAQTHTDQILAVDGEVEGHRDAPARPERQVLALPLVLNDVERDLERLDDRRFGR